MRFVIITGMSGAGKTQVMHFLEDIGYYCIDNMPVAFLLPFAKMCNNESDKFNNVAVVVDIRSGDALLEIGTALDEFRKNSLKYEILFHNHCTESGGLMINYYFTIERKKCTKYSQI